MKAWSLVAAAALGLAAFVHVSAKGWAAAPQVYDFTIPDGWGAKSWNTPDTKFVMHVGDTWRVHNLDKTADHTFHTDGRPCPHGGTAVYDAHGTKVHDGENFDSIPVGGYLECVLGGALDNTDDEVYDHFQYDGQQGRIFIRIAD